MKENGKKLQLNIRLSEEEMEAIDVLARMTGTTKTEAIVTAVRMYKSKEEERKKKLILGNNVPEYDDYEYYDEDLAEDEEGDELCY